MSVKPEDLSFPPLARSLGSTLGDYYQDLRGALVLVESGYHGRMDEDGIPLVSYGRDGTFRNAIHTAQYALANITAVRAGDESRQPLVRKLLNSLVGAQETDGEFAGCWLMRHDNRKYPWLRAPWTSALASGNALSALLRGWQLLGDERYRLAAEAAYDGLHAPRPSMATCRDDGSDLWYEEYPSDPPLHVLNGHIYTLLGVLDWARVTGDPVAVRRWQRGAATVRAHLEEFDLGYWSAYDLRWREPVSLHYQRNIHVPLLRILRDLTGEEIFASVADRWEGYADSLVPRVRWHAAVRSRALRWRVQRVAGRLPGGPHGATAGTAYRREARGCDSVALRPFPYPYRAALAICNDADLMTPQQFRRLHQFIGTHDETEWGPGLGLHIGGSFFMFRSPDSPNELTVFDRLSTNMTREGEFVLECARKGILDVLHTYGCFTEPSHFKRAMAAAAVDTLRANGIVIETWVNHGLAANVQCIGDHGGWQGDAPGTDGYHTDLAVAHGVRWIWTGLEITDRIALSAGDWAGTKSRVRERASVARARATKKRSLVAPYVLRDGQRVRRFVRFAGTGGRTPVLDDLPDQLSGHRLDELVRAGGYAVVYQHLAVRRVREGFGTGAYGPVGGSWFTSAELAALRELARRHHAGEIWVAPTTELLRYHDAHRALAWSARREAGREVIVVRPPRTAIGRGQITDTDADLANVTFYCEEPEKATVYIETDAGRRRVEEMRCNPADVTGRRSVTLLPDARRRVHS